MPGIDEVCDITGIDEVNDITGVDEVCDIIDQRANLLRLMKLDDYLTWINERLEINNREYDLTQSPIANRRIRECHKMRDDFQSQHDKLVTRMSTATPRCHL